MDQGHPNWKSKIPTGSGSLNFDVSGFIVNGVSSVPEPIENDHLSFTEREQRKKEKN